MLLYGYTGGFSTEAGDSGSVHDLSKVGFKASAALSSVNGVLTSPVSSVPAEVPDAVVLAVSVKLFKFCANVAI
jgi:hypothetical protein